MVGNAYGGHWTGLCGLSGWGLAVCVGVVGRPGEAFRRFEGVLATISGWDWALLSGLKISVACGRVKVNYGSSGYPYGYYVLLRLFAFCSLYVAHRQLPGS